MFYNIFTNLETGSNGTSLSLSKGKVFKPVVSTWSWDACPWCSSQPRPQCSALYPHPFLVSPVTVIVPFNYRLLLLHTSLQQRYPNISCQSSLSLTFLSTGNIFKKSKNHRFDGIHRLKYLSFQEFKREFPNWLHITNNVTITTYNYRI